MSDLFRHALRPLPLRFVSGLGSVLGRAVRGGSPRRGRRHQVGNPTEALEARMLLSAVTSNFGVNSLVPWAAIHSTLTTPPSSASLSTPDQLVNTPAAAVSQPPFKDIATPGSLTVRQILDNGSAELTNDSVLAPASASIPSRFQTNYVVSTQAGSTIPLASPTPIGQGYTPAQIQSAYGFNGISLPSGQTFDDAGIGQTIAIVAVGWDPTIFSDILKFNTTFGIGGAARDPQNTDFLKIVNESGGSNITQNTYGALEMALDVEWAHAMAPGANILVVVAETNLWSAISYAASQPDVSVVSISYGLNGEYADQSTLDFLFNTPGGHTVGGVPGGITFVAASGDTGAPPTYPAISTKVLSAGGTSLFADKLGNPDRRQESGWSGSGGGISLYEPQPSYQQGIVTQSTTKRTNPDLSLNSDYRTGFPVCCSYSFGPETPWGEVGGTSAAAPILSSMVAIANQLRMADGKPSLDGASQVLPTLYQIGNPSAATYNPNAILDIKTGNNGYPASPGYDLVTGLGTPNVQYLIPDLVNHVTTSLIVTNTRGDHSIGSINWVLDQANLATGDTTISFDPILFSTPQTITLTGESLQLSNTNGVETILAPGAPLTISGGGLSRVFQIDPGVSANLNGLIITAGQADNGGGIASFGNLTMNGCSISNNNAVEVGGGLFVNSTGSITLTDCTISGNRSQGIGGGGGAYIGLGLANLTNVTISGNTASQGIGGGLEVVGATSLLTNVTISGNSAKQGGAGFNANLSSVTMKNTIVAGNTAEETASDIQTSLTSLTGSRNLIGTVNSGGLVHGMDGNLVGIKNPLLAPLGIYGGTLQTMPLLSGSLAIDAGMTTGAPTKDARGFVRMGVPDIGAFESTPLEVNSNTDGAGTRVGQLNLRQAISLANLSSGTDVIGFDPTFFSSPKTITLIGGQLKLSDSVTIKGLTTVPITINGNSLSRIFEIDNQTTVELSGLTITKGLATNGGGIANFGNLTMTDSTITNNHATGNGGGLSVGSTGSATMQNCTVSNNVAVNGAGIDNAQGTVVLVNTTLAGNEASSVAAELGFKGAVGYDDINSGYYPPDTSAAVGGATGDYLVETVNAEFIVFDKSTGKRLLSESLDTLFAPSGHASGGQASVIWDPLINRWYVCSIDGTDYSALFTPDLLFAISNDDNPLHGFSKQFVIPSAQPTGFADFPKFGYNADYITFSANDYSIIGNTRSVVTVIDKADAIEGKLTAVQLLPAFNFRALVPAQQATAKPGDPIWFVAAHYLEQGGTNNTLRVTKLTNPFGVAVFTDFAVAVNTYGGYVRYVDQPRGEATVAANDNTVSQVFDYNGTLVLALPASTSTDGFLIPKVQYYTIDVSKGTPKLKQQGVVDPGAGVAAFFPSATINPTTGDIGLTWMQSSSSEYVSMYVGTVSAASGVLKSYAAAPGAAYEYYSARNGNYSTVVFDPTTNSFWAANEYAGADNREVVWNTWIQKFSVPTTINRGGGIATVGGAVSLVNCTIANNKADTGGGIGSDGTANIILTNTIVAQNSTDVTGPISGSYNLIGTGGAGGLVNGINGNRVGVANALLAPLGCYGGMSQTMPLLPGSPAINSGISTGAPTTDERGFRRIGGVDQGAFEGELPLLVTTTRDGDFTALGDLNLRQAVNLANILPGANSIQFDSSQFATLPQITLTNGQIVFTDSAMTTVSFPGADLTINGNHASGIFEIQKGAAVSLIGLNITNGTSYIGGGLYVNSGTAMLTNCSLTGNASSDWHGGGLFAYNSTVEMTDCTVSGNSSLVNGAGIFLYSSSLHMSHVNLKDNVSHYVGGGLYSIYSSVTIDGGTISGNRADGGGGGLFDAFSDISISNVTVTENITPNNAGGIYNIFSNLNMTNSSVTGNTAMNGSAGGIANYGGILALSKCRITNNDSGSSGGGVWNNGTLATTDTSISGNAAGINGGGVFNIGLLTITGATISANSAAGQGGGLYNADTGSVTLSNLSLTQNFANHEGGGIYSSGITSLLDLTVNANSALSNGGGIFVNSGQTSITNTTITANLATNGGGIELFQGVASLINVTCSGNNARNRGAGFYGDSGVATFTNSIFAANAGVNSASDIQLDKTSLLGSYNLIGTGGTGGLVDGVNGNQVGVANALLAPLGFYGGMTATMPLLPGSPAIDAGTSTGAATTDQRGMSRVGRVDQGAFEAGSPLVVTSIRDGNDSDFGILNLRQAVNLANVTPGANTIQFDSTRFATAQQITLTGGEIAFSDSALTTILSPAAGLTISGNHLTRVFEVQNGAATNLIGLNIVGGTADQGGGVFINAGYATLTNCSLSGNTSTGFGGGGLYAINSTVGMSDCIVNDNSGANGGGVLTFSSSLNLSNVSVTDNTSAYFGGGIYSSASTMTMVGGAIRSNHAGDSGGGVWNSGTLTLNNTIIQGNFTNTNGGGVYNAGASHVFGGSISGNSAGGQGGGLFNFNSSTVNLSTLDLSENSSALEGGGILNNGIATVKSSSVSRNRSVTGGGVFSNGITNFVDSTADSNVATTNGGGIYIHSGKTTFTNSTISRNVAVYGGGVELFKGEALLTNVTSSGNTATNKGAGFYGDSGIALLKNTIFWGNTIGDSASDIHLDQASIYGSYNLIGTGGAGGLVNGTNGNQVGVASALLAPLGFYGGPTATMPLLPGSPAIDAGTSTDATVNDQRGSTRTGGVDIGSFESSGFTIAMTSPSRQQALINNRFSVPLTGSVRGNNPLEPVTGGLVKFTGPAIDAGAMISSNNVTIALDGSVMTDVTANTIAGSYTVSLNGTGVTIPANFGLTNMILKSNVINTMTVSATYLVSGTVTATETGNDAPGVACVAVYMAINSDPFSLTPLVVLNSGQNGFSFQGQPGNRYYFRSVATDNAGNRETKTTLDASAYIPIPPPVTKVATGAPDTSNATIDLNFIGTAPYGSGLASFAVYASINGGARQYVGTVDAGIPDASGVYRAKFTYQGVADGISRTYAFDSVGTDRSGRVEVAHNSPDISLTQTFTSTPLAYTGLTIQRASTGRSFIRYVSLNFNKEGTDLANLYASIVANPGNYLQLLQRGIGSATNKGISLTGVKFTLVGTSIELDFGASGLGGSARGAATLANYWSQLITGDGWYKLSLDLSGKSNFSTGPSGSFLRLLGDVNGDGKVDATDTDIVNTSPSTITNQNADLNGDGFRDAVDKYLVVKSNGRNVGTNPF